MVTWLTAKLRTIVERSCARIAAHRAPPSSAAPSSSTQLQPPTSPLTTTWDAQRANVSVGEFTVRVTLGDAPAIQLLCDRGEGVSAIIHKSPLSHAGAIRAERGVVHVEWQWLPEAIAAVGTHNHAVSGSRRENSD